MTRRANFYTAGWTLLEMLMTLGGSSLVLTALVVGGIALQRSFAAVEAYSTSDNDELRVSDYIALDVRRALTASVDANNVLTLTIPNYYDANNTSPKWSNAHPISPSFDSNGAIEYSTTSTTVRYYKLASNFVREVNGTASTVATNVSSFNVSSQDLTSSVSCTISFTPNFATLPGPGAVAGTTVYSNTFLRNAVARQ
jgi:hypothetical protein